MRLSILILLHIKFNSLNLAYALLKFSLIDCQIELAKILLNEGQSHLFNHWPDPGAEDEKKKGFFDQVSTRM